MNNDINLRDLNLEDLQSIDGGDFFKKLGEAIGWALADFANYSDYFQANRASLGGATRNGEW